MNAPSGNYVQTGMPNPITGLDDTIPDMRALDIEARVGKACSVDGVVAGDDQTITNGTDVTVIRDDGSKWLTRTRTDPWQLGDGTWVVALEGRAGGYKLDRVRRRREGDA